MTHEEQKRSHLFLILAVLVLGGGAVWWFTHDRAANTDSSAASGRHAGGMAQSVSVGAVDQGDVRVFLEGLGTVTPIANVTVRTRIDGILMKVAFQEGQLVKQGDFLVEVDPRPYQVALETAEGALLRDQALLKEALLDQARYQKLWSQDSIARQTLDVQNNLVGQYQGTIKTDQAAIDSAKLNLIYCHITAPATGRLGLRQVDQGNYVQTSDTSGLVVITQLQPISVIFTLPEDDIPTIVNQPGGADGKPASLPVEAWNRAETMHLTNGTLSTTDNQIDTTTGTVKLRAIFDNANNILFPNQFVNAKLLAETHKNVLRVPAIAVQTGEPGRFVYVLKSDNTVTVRALKLGPQDGDKIEVLSGVAVGDQVVTDGADRLHEGAHVTVPQKQADTAASQPGAANDTNAAPKKAHHHKQDATTP